MRTRDTSFAQDLILLCSRVVGEEHAQKGIRALCRYYGGQLIYIPVRDRAGVSAQKIKRILEDATTDTAAQAMLEKLMFCYGGLQLYIPFEHSSFRKVIALEIYELCGTEGRTMQDVAREYGISGSHAYALWKEGHRERCKRTLPYQPYLEFN
jgi:Mor family transcriptional regulator